jgi:hypothetical protein
MDKQEKLVGIYNILFPPRTVISSAETFFKSIGVSGLTKEQKKEFSDINDKMYNAQVAEFTKNLDIRFTENEVNRLFSFYNSVVFAQWNTFNHGFFPKLMNFQFDGGDEIQSEFNDFMQSIVDENGPVDDQDQGGMPF